MNILLTNDDGYNSQGILLLKELLEPYGTVVICAPSGPMSAKSVSITLGKGIKVEQVEKNVYKCDGTPADCVSFALNTMNEKFDLVVSGCNHGFNISYDTMYSGTIGAALEALRNHTPSIAVSVEHNFELVRNHFKEVFDYIIKEKLLSKEYLLNINFPLGDEVKGMKIATLYYRNDQYYFIKKEDGRGRLRCSAKCISYGQFSLSDIRRIDGGTREGDESGRERMGSCLDESGFACSWRAC